MSLQSKMVDAIKDGKIVVVSEQEARDDDLFVLRVHEATSPLPDLPSAPARMVREKVVITKPVARYHSYEPSYKKNNVVKELADNFHWEIAKARKARNLSRLQLANILGVPEAHVRMLENGELPSDDFILVNKLQQSLGINLRRDGKSFDTPIIQPKPAGPSYIAKPDLAHATLSDLQRMKEKREKAREEAKEAIDDSLFGDDIQLSE